MNKRALANQLLAIQGQVQSALDILFDGGDPMCDHPQGDREDWSTLGNEHWKCKLCGYEYKEE